MSFYTYVFRKCDWLNLNQEEILKSILRKHTNKKKIDIVKRENIRPYIYDNEISFNASHSRKYYAIAVSLSHIVSIDIEDKKNSDISVIDRKTWTIKEAASKINGDGLSIILKGSNVNFVKKTKDFELWRVNFVAEKSLPTSRNVIYMSNYNDLHLSVGLSKKCKENYNGLVTG
ncbi:hypothetical protein A3712_00310 [Vibrio sp. HI00D65]|uniref:4'-phosphopantetheinyl transferase family protein n=1 Tax=Vibrio sp. HI00D65 TaxID=1822216 RepID=UPI0007B839F6|nr:hypothetical protein [Vibrio sp. HI00D65]KZX70652.1 hypothetical protein A3712_00310 [Vibrio sp. HI00D65]